MRREGEISVSLAARWLGVSRHTVERLAIGGRISYRTEMMPGCKYRKWWIGSSSVRALMGSGSSEHRVAIADVLADALGASFFEHLARACSELRGQNATRPALRLVK